MSEIDVQAILKTVLCSHPGCPDDAETGRDTCARHVYAVPGYDPVNGCKVANCLGAPVNTRGIYAYLCADHAAEKRMLGGGPNVNAQRERLARASTPSGREPIIPGQTPREIAARIRDAAIALERAQARVDHAKAQLSAAKREWRDVLQEAAR